MLVCRAVVPEGGDSVALLVSPSGIAAEASDRPLHRLLVDHRIEHPRYDSLREVLWFVHDARLEALDLGAPAGSAIVVIKAMPNLPYSTDRCDVCVCLDLVVAGRSCDCEREECMGKCVLQDPTSGRFASILDPES